MNAIMEYRGLFFEGAKLTLALTLCSGLMGLALGTAAGIAKTQPGKALRSLATAYTWLLRGTPLLVQILFVYYALPALSPHLRFSEFTAAVIALSLNVGAYNAEAIRAGIEAVPRGQRKAARSLGLSQTQEMRLVVLPQAFRIAMPPLVSNLAALLKDSSLASTIGLLELTLVGNRISSETFAPVPPLVTVATIYLLITTVLTLSGYALESRRKARTA